MRWRPVVTVVLPLAAAVLLALLVASTWWVRVPYPYDLEWMEGGMLAHAWRLVHGLPIYGPPSPDFTPYIYPPGYSFVVAALGEVVGLSPALGRLVSIAGALGALSSLVFALRRLGGPWELAVGTAAVFLGTYPAGGAFLDLVRPDGLCLGLLGWSLALALVKDRRAVVASGLLLAAAFLVKQNAAVFGVPLLLAIARRDGWRTAGGFAAASMGPALLAVVALELWTGGWFLAYLVEVPSTHALMWDAILQQAPREWGTPLPVALTVITGAVLWSLAESPGPVPRWLATLLPVTCGMVVGAVGTYNPPGAGSDLLNSPSAVAFFAIGAIPPALALRALGRVSERRSPSWRVWFAVGVGAIAMVFSGWMRGHVGGFLNVHLPGYYAVALLFGWVCVWARERWPTEGTRLVVGLAMAAQITWSIARFDRASLVPTPEDYARGDAVVAAIRDVKGPVLSPFAAWLPVYAGKPPSLHYQGLWDLELSSGRYHDQVKVVRNAVRKKYWGAVLAGNQKFPYPLQDGYQPKDKLFEGKGPGLMPKTGYKARPERLLVRKP